MLVPVACIEMTRSRCSGGICSIRFWAEGDRSICCCIKRTKSIFCAATMPKAKVITADRSQGFHQLEFSFRSSNVLEGAMNALMSRDGSERPGCEGSAAGTGGVAVLIYHPSKMNFEKGYAILARKASVIICFCVAFR